MQTTDSRAEVSCPYCHNPVDVVPDDGAERYCRSCNQVFVLEVDDDRITAACGDGDVKTALQ